jgi:hypothetical protein
MSHHRRNLPAAVASTAAISTSITAISSSTTASSAATPATAGSSATATPAKAATSAPTASTSTAALTRRPRFVDYDVPAHEIVAIQSLDRAFGLLIVGDFNKSEPAWLS